MDLTSFITKPCYKYSTGKLIEQIKRFVYMQAIEKANDHTYKCNGV